MALRVRMEKVIFLDIDGVICVKPPSELDANCITALKSIVEATNAQVVLSSTWRLYDDLFKIVYKTLRREGIRIAAKTKDLGDKPRSDEIQLFIAEHPTIKKFAILDDSFDAEIKGSYFGCNYPDGLTLEIATRAIQHLQGE